MSIGTKKPCDLREGSYLPMSENVNNWMYVEFSDNFVCHTFRLLL